MNGWINFAAPTGIAMGVIACAQVVLILDQGKRSKSANLGRTDKITTVCYLFSLAAWLTLLAGTGLVWSGQVTDQGAPVSGLATYAFLLAGESIQFEREAMAVGVVLSIIIVPQILNYFVAGLFGAAGGTRFGAWCLRFAFWTILKGFAVAGGVSVAWGLLALCRGWPSAYETTPSESIGTGLAQIALASLFSTLAGPLEDSSLRGMRRRMRPFTQPLMPLHEWLTRNREPAEDET